MFARFAQTQMRIKWGSRFGALAKLRSACLCLPGLLLESCTEMKCFTEYHILVLHLEYHNKLLMLSRRDACFIRVLPKLLMPHRQSPGIVLFDGKRVCPFTPTFSTRTCIYRTLAQQSFKVLPKNPRSRPNAEIDEACRLGVFFVFARQCRI